MMVHPCRDPFLAIARDVTFASTGQGGPVTPSPGDGGRRSRARLLDQGGAFSPALVAGDEIRYFGGIKNFAIRADFLSAGVEAEAAADVAAALLEENRSGRTP